jgi:ribosomal protein L12E/L44/L45/RPP1/RPP2
MKTKTILASFLAVAFLAGSPVFAADNPAGSDKAEKGDKKKKDDKKKDEKKEEGAKSGGGGW